MRTQLFVSVLFSCLVVAICYPEEQEVTRLPRYTKLDSDQISYLQNKGFGPTQKSVGSTVSYREEDEEEYEDNEPEPTQNRQAAYVNQNYPIPVRTTASKVYPTAPPKIYAIPPQDARRTQPQIQQTQFVRRGDRIEQAENELEKEEEKEEEPDRLSLLLPQSKFQCANRKTGYYADEDLGCEVFHYCQDNAKHSWICPEGFTFHQVHLICMPPGGDNICEKSSDYHFVNEFLYKPVNLQEHQQKPNVTLKYSDRYFPDSYRSRYDEEEEDDRPVHHQHSVRVQAQPQQRIQAYHQQAVQPSTLRPQASIGQVFRSPEEINISLQQRRPHYTTAKIIDY